jgi:hypothetical protein
MEQGVDKTVLLIGAARIELGPLSLEIQQAIGVARVGQPKMLRSTKGTSGPPTRRSADQTDWGVVVQVALLNQNQDPPQSLGGYQLIERA